jgi:hypothetical protein
MEDLERPEHVFNHRNNTLMTGNNTFRETMSSGIEEEENKNMEIDLDNTFITKMKQPAEISIQDNILGHEFQQDGIQDHKNTSIDDLFNTLIAIKQQLKEEEKVIKSSHNIMVNPIKVDNCLQYIKETGSMIVNLLKQSQHEIQQMDLLSEENDCLINGKQCSDKGQQLDLFIEKTRFKAIDLYNQVQEKMKKISDFQRPEHIFNHEHNTFIDTKVLDSIMEENLDNVMNTDLNFKINFNEHDKKFSKIASKFNDANNDIMSKAMKPVELPSQNNHGYQPNAFDFNGQSKRSKFYTTLQWNKWLHDQRQLTQCLMDIKKSNNNNNLYDIILSGIIDLDYAYRSQIKLINTTYQWEFSKQLQDKILNQWNHMLKQDDEWILNQKLEEKFQVNINAIQIPEYIPHNNVEQDNSFQPRDYTLLKEVYEQRKKILNLILNYMDKVSWAYKIKSIASEPELYDVFIILLNTLMASLNTKLQQISSIGVNNINSKDLDDDMNEI